MRNIIPLKILISVFAVKFILWLPVICAQERVQTPPDTTKKTGQKLPPQDEKPRLELPDVLIYGTDRSVRMTGEKVESQQKDVKMIAPTTDYQSLVKELDSEYQKKHFQGSKWGSGSQTILQLDAGRFSQFGILAGRYQESENYNYSVQGNYNRSNGQYQNSQYYEGSLKAQAGVRISPNFIVSGNGCYRASDYGLYGAEIEELSRKISIGKFKINSQWSNSPDQTIEAALNYQQNLYNDRDTTDYRAELAERNISLSTGFQSKIGSFPVSIHGLYQYSRLNPENEAIVSQKYLQLKSSLSFSLKHYVTVKPGLVFENLELKPSFSGNYFSPELEIVATPYDRLGVLLRIGRGYSPLTFLNNWELNQFVSQEVRFIPSKKELEVKLGIEFNPLSNVTISGSVLHQKWDNYSYWKRETGSGLFTMNALKNLSLTTFSLQNRIDLMPNLKLDAGIQFILEDVPADSSPGNNQHTPYLERFRMPVSLGYQFDNTTEVRLAFHWIGSRFISLNDDKKLSAFGLLQVSIEKRLHNHFSVYVKGDNLLNQDYQLWQNFPGMKLYFEIGIKGNW
jgi:hypothetical protein